MLPATSWVTWTSWRPPTALSCEFVVRAGCVSFGVALAPAAPPQLCRACGRPCQCCCACSERQPPSPGLPRLTSTHHPPPSIVRYSGVVSRMAADPTQALFGECTWPQPCHPMARLHPATGRCSYLRPACMHVPQQVQPEREKHPAPPPLPLACFCVQACSAPRWMHRSSAMPLACLWMMRR